MTLETMDAGAIATLENELSERFDALKDRGLDLDLTRGKPAADQLELSDGLDDTIGGDYAASDGTDARGYGGLDGLPETKRIAAAWLGVQPDEIIIGGNSSLTLMYLFLLGAHRFGLGGPDSAWDRSAAPARFICPVPGYDRHFGICEDLGIDMITVPMTGHGPDMDAVERIVREDAGVRGLWCVPKYSNPSGEIYSDDTVRRIARLGRDAHPGFRIMWDNAYAVHDLGDEPDPLLDVMACCREAGTQDSVVLFGSTSKVTFAGAGLAFFGGSRANVDAFKKRLAVMTIGPDKVNQLRHARFLPDMDAVKRHMRAHAERLKPKFDLVDRALSDGLGNRAMGTWTTPRGGYFVSFESRPGLAPSFPPLKEVEQAMEVFVTAVQLASVRDARARRGAA